MQPSRKLLIKVIGLSVILIFLIFLHVYLGKQKITLLCLHGYMLLTSFSLTKFFEKRGIIERFGFQRNNALGLLVVTYFGLAIVYYFKTGDIAGIFFAPLFEEIFFRGYLLGTLCQHDQNEWKWILLTSFLFGSSHIFQKYPTFPLTESIWAVFTPFIGGLFLGFLYMRLRTILWCFLVHMLYNLFPPYRLSILMVGLLIILLEFLMKRLFQDKQETDISFTHHHEGSISGRAQKNT